MHMNFKNSAAWTDAVIDHYGGNYFTDFEWDEYDDPRMVTIRSEGKVVGQFHYNDNSGWLRVEAINGN